MRKSSMSTADRMLIGGMLGLPMVAVFMALMSLAGLITHIVICIKTQMWLLLIAGAIFFPVGVVHGWGVWFGWWH